MKIELDTTKKEVTIKESVNLHELYETLNDLLPGGEWREYTLKHVVSITIDHPYHTPNTTPIHPYNDPYIPRIGDIRFGTSDGTGDITFQNNTTTLGGR